MGRIWFTSDMHYGHRNIIQYAGRPFKDSDEMDREMIDQYCKTVKPEDTVYFLGDISFYRDTRRTVELFSFLPGQKYLVFGNHDKKLRKDPEFLKLFGWTSDLKEIKVEDSDAESGQRRITLCHYAMRVWNKSHFGAYHLYGHSHGSLSDDPHALSLDVGVDCWDFRPVSYEQVKERMQNKEFRPVDHHDRERYGRS